MRTTPNKWAVRLGNAYVEFFRNIPLLVQLFLWFFVLPELLPNALGTAIKQMAPPGRRSLPAVIGLGLFTAARVKEQVRAGIQALSRGQGQAARQSVSRSRRATASFSCRWRTGSSCRR